MPHDVDEQLIDEVRKAHASLVDCAHIRSLI
jgi:hypothetical protein